MAVPAFDAAITGDVDNLTTITLAHSVADNPNRLILLGVSTEDGEGHGTPTWEGNNMTNLGGPTDQNDVRGSWWYYLNPSIGSNDAVVLVSVASRITICISSYYNVSQGNPFGTVITTTAGPDVTAITSGTITGRSDGLFVDHVTAGIIVDGNVAVITGQTQRAVDYSSYGNNPRNKVGCSTEPGAATATMGWTFSSNQHWVHFGVSLNPSAVGNQVIYMMSTNTWWDKINDILRPKILVPELIKWPQI